MKPPKRHPGPAAQGRQVPLKMNKYVLERWGEAERSVVLGREENWRRDGGGRGLGFTCCHCPVRMVDNSQDLMQTQAPDLDLGILWAMIEA